MSVAADNPEPQVGDIWQELDRRLTAPRYIRVKRIESSYVFFTRVLPAGHSWYEADYTGCGYALRRRFSGRAGGYKLHERPPP